MKNLKQYTHQPDPGLFDTIQRRLRRRRLLRRGGTAVGLVVILGVAALLLVNHTSSPAPSTEMATLQPSTPLAATAAEVPPQPETIATTPAPTASATVSEPVEAPTPVATPTPQPQPTTPSSVAVNQQTYTPLTPTPRADAPAPVVAPRTSPIAQPIASTDTSDSSSPSFLTPHTSLHAPTPKSENDVTEVDVWAPNVIIPDGDVEENRTFRLRFTDDVSDFKLYIFNRNGRQLAYSNDPLYQWDGTYNGTRLPQGAYVWVLQFRDSEGRPMQKKGTVTLLR